LTYPEIFVGALAASAPIGYYDREGWAQRNITENTWADRVAHSYGRYPRCLDAIAATNEALRRAPFLKKRLRLCDGSALGTDHAALFQYALEGLPQQNYPPLWPVRATCETLVHATDRVAAAEAIIMATLGNGTCVEVPAEGPGGVPGDGPGVGSWGFQSCTDTLHQFSSATPVRRYAFDMAELDGFLEDDGATAKPPAVVAPSPPRAAPVVAPPPAASPKQVVAVPVKTFDPFAM